MLSRVNAFPSTELACCLPEAVPQMRGLETNEGRAELTDDTRSDAEGEPGVMEESVDLRPRERTSGKGGVSSTSLCSRAVEDVQDQSDLRGYALPGHLLTERC